MLNARTSPASCSHSVEGKKGTKSEVGVTQKFVVRRIVNVVSLELFSREAPISTVPSILPTPTSLPHHPFLPTTNRSSLSTSTSIVTSFNLPPHHLPFLPSIPPPSLTTSASPDNRVSSTVVDVKNTKDSEGIFSPDREVSSEKSEM